MSNERACHVLHRPNVESGALLLVVDVHRTVVRFVIQIARHSYVECVVSHLGRVFRLVASKRGESYGPISIVVRQEIGLDGGLPIRYKTPINCILVIRAASNAIGVDMFSFRPLTRAILGFQGPGNDLGEGNETVYRSGSFLPFPTFNNGRGRSIDNAYAMGDQDIQAFRGEGALGVFLVCLSNDISMICFDFA